MEKWREFVSEHPSVAGFEKIPGAVDFCQWYIQEETAALRTEIFSVLCGKFNIPHPRVQQFWIELVERGKWLDQPMDAAQENYFKGPLETLAFLSEKES